MGVRTPPMPKYTQKAKIGAIVFLRSWQICGEVLFHLP